MELVVELMREVCMCAYVCMYVYVCMRSGMLVLCHVFVLLRCLFVLFLFFRVLSVGVATCGLDG